MSMSSAFHESRGDEGISDRLENADTSSVELDPLTSPVWIADDEDTALAPPLEEFEALYEADHPGSSEPIIVPGVDEIISGEYTGWVPIIGPDTLPDGSTRADQYRVTENVDPVKDAIAKGLEPSAVTGAFTVREDARVTKFDDFVEDPDQLVVSPAKALEEARRRIEEMRASLKVNVTEVAATITGEFIPTSLTNTNVVPDPSRIHPIDVAQVSDIEGTDEPVAELVRDIPAPIALPHQRIHPIPVPQPPMNPIVEAIVGAEPVFDQNEPTLGVDDVYSSIIFERIAALRIAREQLEAEEHHAAALTSPVPDTDEFDTVVIKLPTAINPERDEPGYVTESVEVDPTINFVEPDHVSTPVHVAVEVEESAAVDEAIETEPEVVVENIAHIEDVVDSDVVSEFVAAPEPEVVTELREEFNDIHHTGAFLREILDEIAKDSASDVTEEPVAVVASVIVPPVETPVVPVISAPIPAPEPIAVQESFEDLFGDDFIENTAAPVVEAPAAPVVDSMTPIFDAVTEIVNLKPETPAAPAPEVATELAAEVSEPAQVREEPQVIRESNQEMASQEAPRVFAQSSQQPHIIMHEEQQSATQLELVIMRDEIQDLRNRLDSNQKLVEDLMIRLSDLAMAALTRRD